MTSLALVAWLLPFPAEAQTGVTDLTAAAHAGPVRALIVLPSAKPGGSETVVTGGLDGRIVLRQAPSLVPRKALEFHRNAVTVLAALTPGCFASGGEDARVAIWCAEADRPTRVLLGHDGPISALARSPDGKWLVSGGWDHRVILHDLLDPNSPPRVLRQHQSPIGAATFLGDGDLVLSGSFDATLHVTRLSDATSRALQSPAPVAAMIRIDERRIGLARADGHLAIVGPDMSPLHDLDLETGPLSAIAISPDSRLLAAAGPRSDVTLIDPSDTRAIRHLSGRDRSAWAIAFSGDGARLYTGGTDGTVQAWSVASGAVIASGDPPADPLDAIRRKPPERGAEVFRACQVCHDITEAPSSRAGPTLHGVMGRRIGSVPGYAYSPALRDSATIWSEDTISKLFEIGPEAYLPGTRMPEQRITDPQDRKALVEWLSRVTRP